MEIWSNIVNNENAFKNKKNKSDSDSVELTSLEKLNLYEMLSKDKVRFSLIGINFGRVHQRGEQRSEITENRLERASRINRNSVNGSKSER